MSHHHHNHEDGHLHIQQIPTLPSQSLYKKIELSGVSGLNFVNSNDELAKLFKSSETKYEVRPIFESDLDNQLVLKIPFSGNVKLYSIIIRSNGNADSCPKNVKLYKNNNQLDFNTISSVKPDHKFEHPLVGYQEDADYASSQNEQSLTVEDDSTFVEHHLPRTTFTNVNSLTIFFENNWSNDEDELLKIYSIEFRGEFTELNRAPVITLYESAANPADHKTELKELNANTRQL